MKYKYTTRLILVSAMLLAQTVNFSVKASPLHAEEWCGKAKNRREGCPLVQVKDNGGYVPPNHGGPDSRNGTGTRYAQSQK